MKDIMRSFARPLAERFAAGERLALRRWLRLNKGVSLTGMEALKMRINSGDIVWLSKVVDDHGGNPEELREKGIRHVMWMIDEECGGMKDA